MEEDNHFGFQRSDDGLPLQFEDFFVLSLGKADGRPSYYDVNLIQPIGYRSCWHDKITGSLYMCEVLEGGDSGPIYKITRCSCSEFPVPIGSTILCMKNLGQFASQTNVEIQSKSYDNKDWDDDGSIQMILSDPCLPTENDVFSCLGSTSHKASNPQTSDTLQPVVSSVLEKPGYLLSDDLGLIDEIGKISVEERSSSSAWRLMSQKVINVCYDICKRKGNLKFFCKHVHNETCLPKWQNEACSTSLAKFCALPGSVSIPSVIQANSEMKFLYQIFAKWIEQDRFGLDVEFVQEVLEQLPGVGSCSYQFLKSRSNYPTSLTVGNGFLVVKSKGGLDYINKEASQGLYWRSKKARLVEDSEKVDYCPPPGKPLCSRVPRDTVGDVFQAWELLWRFHEILGLKEPLSLDELEEELINPWFDGSSSRETFDREPQGSLVSNSQRIDGSNRLIFSSSCGSDPSFSGGNLQAFIEMETEATKEAAQVKLASFTYSRCSGVALTKAHSSLLGVLISELQCKVAALVDPNFDPGESRTKRGRKKDIDSSIPAKLSKLNLLPVNELTWPELARRYILAFLSMDGTLESAENIARESGKVFRCLQGDGGLLSGSLTGVAGMEADALLLAEATKKIFGSLTRHKVILTVEDEGSEAIDSSKKVLASDGNIPEWAQTLEPVRKLPTNVGTRIRKCVNEALAKDPPEWARKVLEHSISKEVYKGNASGPTKKAVLSVLADVRGVGLQQPKSNKGRKMKTVIAIPDIIMKQCRIVLRHAAAADDAKDFCNLLGRKLINSTDNDDEGLLGSPAMVSRPLDFRTIDLRLAAGAYGGSHESFVEDVRELWNNIRVAYVDQPDLLELAEKLSKNFESLYEKEVVAYVQKFVEYAKLECLSAELKKDLDVFMDRTSEIPKAPWDEGVCKVCGFDKDDDSVLLCDTCDAEYHTYCLNPPLARIPEGNWYCPSCLGKHTVQDVPERPQVIGQSRSKRFLGEVSSLYLDALMHLSALMEEKEYWEYSVGERAFLLKFLCDEVLNSSLIRQHLEQCAELSAELHQKLRAFCVEWKNLKAKEDILSAKAGKVDTYSLNASGEVGQKDGVVSSMTNPSKCPLQPHISNDRRTNFGVISDNKPPKEIGKETWVRSVDKNLSLSTSETENHNMNPMDVERQLKNVCDAAVDSKLPVDVLSCMDSQIVDECNKPNESPSSNHLANEICDSGKEIHIKGNLQNEGRGVCTLPTSFQEGQCTSVDMMGVHASQTVSQVAGDESEPYRFELNAVKNDISLLQDSMTSVESQLLKLSVRRDFLGADSSNRLYWASAISGRCPSIVVDASDARLHGNKRTDNKDQVDKKYCPSGNEIFHTLGMSKTSFPFTSKPGNALGNYSPWTYYETEAEIEGLIGWLMDNDPKARELKESIMHWRKQRLRETKQIRSRNEDGHQVVVTEHPHSEKTVIPNCLVTKAASLLEKKYGPCFEWDTVDIMKKRGKKSRITNDEKLYRCECLELIWPTRQHCLSCHKTFSSEVELEGHDDVKCSSGLPAFEKNKDLNESGKGRGSVKCEAAREECRGDVGKDVTSTNGRSEISSTLIQFQNEGMASPYNFEDICSKFETKDSNKELVREIGLIGSDGIPSFAPSLSPYLSDSTLMLISQKGGGVSGGEPKASERQIPQGVNNVSNACYEKTSDDSLGKSVANEISKERKTNRPILGCSQKDKKSSFGSHGSEMGTGHCCVVPLSSLRPLVGKVSHILRQLKINLLDMEAALSDDALRPSKAQLERRWAWRAFVKCAGTIYEMVQATIVLEDMIKTEYLKNDWWYWSSLSAAAKTSTLSSLALRIYSLDAAIIYEKNSCSSGVTDCLKPGNIVDQKLPAGVDTVERPRANRKSSRKRKELMADLGIT
ncbi:Methyl-CpG-binding domain-containing protein 9 [Quillaja saponaria]|uniref:Methyl-CpG-binding domain-containing protein 9 n=1 Tax=Quillaja saponaria TaxID=32244 RepID=A0AAD7Q467_QUISA|nr:Methyl-CpG-binding domain-containing protein 9 [Quillaja saponaria]